MSHRVCILNWLKLVTAQLNDVSQEMAETAEMPVAEMPLRCRMDET